MRNQRLLSIPRCCAFCNNLDIQHKQILGTCKWHVYLPTVKHSCKRQQIVQEDQHNHASYI